MVKKIIVVVVLLPFLILMLSPKKELLYLLEKRLATQGIVISDGVVDESLFGLTIEHPVLYFKGIKVATASKISLWTVLLYTEGTIETLVTDSSLKAYVPEKIEKISLVHSVATPTNAAITFSDQVFAGEGSVDLKNRKVHLLFPSIPAKSSVTRYLKHTKGGWTYEQQF